MSTENLETQEFDQNSTAEPVNTDNSTVDTSQDNGAEVDGIDPNQPVTNLDDAHKVLEAQAKSRAKAKVNPAAASKNNTNTAVDYKKQYDEIQKLVGQQSKELGELRKFYKSNQPVIDAYKQYLAQQQEAELASKYQQDPVGVLKELARREAQSQVAPYQEQISEAQAIQISNGLREHLGQNYDNYAPVMAEVLDQFLQMDEAQGSTYAAELAQNPQILMQLAAGKMKLQEESQQVQRQQVAQQKKTNNLRVASGVGKGNTTTSSQAVDFKNLSLDEMRQTLKKQGIIT